MATGPEHYQRAEEILTEVRKAQASMTGKPTAEQIAQFTAEAQVHATLALAAATGLNDADGGMSMSDHRAWRNAASVETAKR